MEENELIAEIYITIKDVSFTKAFYEESTERRERDWRSQIEAFDEKLHFNDIQLPHQCFQLFYSQL